MTTRNVWSKETPIRVGFIWWKETEHSPPDVLYVSQISGQRVSYGAAYHRNGFPRAVEDIGGLWGPAIQEPLHK